AVGLGVWASSRSPRLRMGMAAAGLAGAGAGLLITLLGGRLMGGSLDLLAERFSDSRLRLGQLGAMFGETGFGPVTHAVTAALEGALFAACVAGAVKLAQRGADREA